MAKVGNNSGKGEEVKGTKGKKEKKNKESKTNKRLNSITCNIYKTIFTDEYSKILCHDRCELWFCTSCYNMDKSQSIWVLVTEAYLTLQCTNSRDTCFSNECQDKSEAKFWRELAWADSWKVPPMVIFTNCELTSSHGNSQRNCSHTLNEPQYNHTPFVCHCHSYETANCHEMKSNKTCTGYNVGMLLIQVTHFYQVKRQRM